MKSRGRPKGESKVVFKRRVSPELVSKLDALISGGSFGLGGTSPTPIVQNVPEPKETAKEEIPESFQIGMLELEIQKKDDYIAKLEKRVRDLEGDFSQ
jgi:hypothetical protein